MLRALTELGTSKPFPSTCVTVPPPSSAASAISTEILKIEKIGGEDDSTGDRPCRPFRLALCPLRQVVQK